MDTTAAPPTLDQTAGTVQSTSTVQGGDAARVRKFILPMDELERIREAGGPLAEADLSKLVGRALVAVVEVDGRIVAYWPVWQAVHAEPLWVTEAARNNPAVIRGILDQVEVAIDQFGDPLIFAIIEEGNELTSGAYASRLGFEKVPGELWVLYRKMEEGN